MPIAQLVNTLALLGLGGLVAAYWYRVLRMAQKTRRRTGQAANLVPPEPLGRLLRLLWAPAIVTWVVHPFVSALLRPLPAILSPIWVPVPAIGAAVSGAGMMIAAGCLAATVVCWRKMGTSWRMGIDPGEKTQFIATGPFAFVRHPIYALSIVMMLATVVAIGSPVMLAAGLVHITLIVWESAREERHMLRVHGAVYADYRRRVGRFVPGRWR